MAASGGLDNDLAETIVLERYKQGEKIGQGGYSHICSAIDILTNEPVALKLERWSRRTTRPPLEHEARVYGLLSGCLGVPNVYGYGRTEAHNVLILDLLGPSLEDLRREHGGRFSLKTVLMLADQLLERVEAIHSRGFLHRDLKPDNLLVGREEQAGRVFVIDFGLARRYLDSRTGRHNQLLEEKDFVGTHRYASLNAHLGYSQSRRDDLESIAYTLIYLARGALPWQNLKAASPKQRADRIREKKRSWAPERLTAGLPPEFSTFLAYVRRLGFEEAPDYAYSRSLFAEFMRRDGYVHDSVFDWSPGAPLVEKPERTETEDDVLSPSPKVPEAPPEPLPDLAHLRGAYLFIKLLARPTLENDASADGKTDTSFGESTALSLPEWHFPWRPAVVYSAKPRRREGGKSTLATLQILPLMQREGGLRSLTVGRRGQFVPLSTGEAGAEEFVVKPTPIWTLPDTYHYNTHYIIEVAVDIDRVKDIPIHWRLPTAALERLLAHVFNDATRPPYEEGAPVNPDDGTATVSVKRHETRGAVADPYFADACPMLPETVDADALEGERVEWGSSVGWLREKNRITRRRMEEWGIKVDASEEMDDEEMMALMYEYSEAPPRSRRRSCTVSDLDDEVRVAPE